VIRNKRENYLSHEEVLLNDLERLDQHRRKKIRELRNGSSLRFSGLKEVMSKAKEFFSKKKKNEGAVPEIEQPNKKKGFWCTARN